MAVVLLLIGCSSNSPEQSGDLQSDYYPLIVIQFLLTEESADLPWAISSEEHRISASMMLPEDGDISRAGRQLVQEAVNSAMLVALVSDSCPVYQTGADHIQIWIDSTGNIQTLPAELITEIPGSAWLDNAARQDILLQLFDTYKPDLILMDFRITDVSSVLQIAEYWTRQEILSRYIIVLYSFPSNARGWCVLAGEKINGTAPNGLSLDGLFSTIRLLAGLKWEDRLPEHVPALSILEDVEDIWSHQ